MARIRLGEEDGKRFDRPDWLPFHGNLNNREAIFLEEELGITGVQWDRMLTGQLVLDEAGAPILVKGKPLRGLTARALNVIVWLALTRSGVDIAYNDLVYDHTAVQTAADEETDDESGKDPDSEP